MLHTVIDRLGSSELTRNQVGASRYNFGIINDLEVCITASKLLFEGDENLLKKGRFFVKSGFNARVGLLSNVKEDGNAI